MATRRETALKYFDENRAFMDTVVKENTERYRKGNFKISVVDKDGKPVNAAVRATLKNHAFRLGANIFMLDEFAEQEKNEIYKERFKALFNLATIPFYWSDLEPEDGKPRFAKDSPRIYRRPATDLCVEFCEENGIEPKCHCLNYVSFTPEWLKGVSAEEYKKRLDRRMRELAERYADRIPSWEVTNESFNGYPQYEDIFKCDDFIEWSFERGDRYFPNNRLIINDWAVWGDGYLPFRWNRSPYYMQIERLLGHGCRHLDSIGMQFHSFFRVTSEADCAAFRYNPLHLYEVMDTYAKFGKKLQITEMTIPAYSGSEEDEAIQAELAENVYRVFFSHPAMEAIIYWNLPDGYAAFAPLGDMTAGENKYHGGILRFDLSEKPIYKALYRLFKEEFHTDETFLSSEKNVFRGFYGDYDVTVTVNGKEIQTKAAFLSGRDNTLTVTV